MLHIKGFQTARRASASCALISTAVLVSACAGTGGDVVTAALAPPASQPVSMGQPVQASIANSALSNNANSPPANATATPTGEQAILKKAHQLRLSGKKQAALKVLDKAENSETSASIVKQRGMLALELGQLTKAEKLLTRARDNHEPDWRVHSALGSALSARGNQQAAQLEFSKALKLAPGHPSVLNNLALSYALDGNHDQAEALLRRAATHDNVKTKQNLALILGLNGNVQEAHKVSRLVLPKAKADANVAYFQNRKTKNVKVSKSTLNTASKPIQSASADRVTIAKH